VPLFGFPGASATSRGHQNPKRSSATQATGPGSCTTPPNNETTCRPESSQDVAHRTPTATGCSEVHCARVLRPRVALKASMTSNGRMPNGYLRRKAALRHLNERPCTQSRRQTTRLVKGVLCCGARAVRRPVLKTHSGQRFPPSGGPNPRPGVGRGPIGSNGPVLERPRPPLSRP
jgi:hypothetical protein